MNITRQHIRVTGAACAMLVFAACEPITGAPELTPTPAANVVAARPNAAAVEVTTPRPDLFSQRALAAWDGRPSLGGAWIAHPDVNSAERASVTEVATGRSITVALFRRDPSIPGPPFQLSAEAAQQLGIQPGVTIEVDVVAIRRSVTADGHPTPEVAVRTPPAPPQPEEVAATPQVAEVTPATAPVVTPIARPEIAAVVTPEITPPAAAPAPAVVSGTPPVRPFMQVGTFGVAANASALVERLEDAGLSARAVPSGALTRVLAGPARSTAELAILREKLREMGFTDALAVAL